MDIVILTYWLVLWIIGSKIVANLIPKLKENVINSYAKGTWDGYEGDWRKYVEFCEEASLQALPPDPIVISLFITYLQQNKLALKTIERTISGIKFWVRDSGYGFPDMDFVFDRVMTGIKKTAPPVDKKEAITVEYLIMVRKMLDAYSPANIRNWLILLVSFFALLRISEVLKLRWEDIVRKGDIVWLHIAPSKKQLQWEWVPIVAHQSKDICPITALEVWATLCDKAKTMENVGIFRYANKMRITSGKSIQVGQGRMVCKQLMQRAGLQADKLITHGARRGGYQLCEHTLVAETDAQHMGRWMNIETMKEYSGGHLAARLRVAKTLAKAVR